MTNGKAKTQLDANLHGGGAAPRPSQGAIPTDISPEISPFGSDPYGQPPGYARAGDPARPYPLRGIPAPANAGTVPEQPQHGAVAPASAAGPSGRPVTVLDLGEAAPSPATAPAPRGNVAPAPTSGREIHGWLLSADRRQSRQLYAGTNRVGSAPDNDIYLEDPLVSSFMCNIVCGDESVAMLVDPQVRNLPMVNDKKIYMPTEIDNLARIQLGSQQWLLVLAPRL